MMLDYSYNLQHCCIQKCLTLFLFSDNENNAGGLPRPVQPDQLARNLQAAAQETMTFRHPGPHISHHDPVAAAAQDLPRPQVIPQGDNWSEDEYSGQFQANILSTRPPEDRTWTVPLNSVVPHQALYVKTCRRCSWSTIPTSDPLAYSGAVADYESHLREDHPELKDTGDAGSRSKENDEYKRATQLRKVETTQDDAFSNLCEARFWRTPLSWRNTQLQLPMEQLPLCTVGDFEPLGLEVNNRKLLSDLHNRSCRSLKLKYFSDQNLKIVPAQQDTLVGFERGAGGKMYTAKAYKELNGVKDAIKAVHNYMELNRYFHPLDSGPQVLYRVLFEKFVEGLVSPDPIVKFFTSIQWELANRASKKELPYKYEELLIKWDTTIRQPSAFGISDSAELDKKIDQKVKETLSRGGGGGGGGNQLGPPQKRPRPQNNPWCPLYNTPSGCSNVRQGKGCKDHAGKIFRHGCNVRKADNKSCNSYSHNAHDHK